MRPGERRHGRTSRPWHPKPNAAQTVTDPVLPLGIRAPILVPKMAGREKITIATLLARKQERQKFAMLTCYD